MREQTLELAEPSGATENPTLSVVPRDLVLTRCKVVIMSSLLRAVLHSNLSMVTIYYSTSLFCNLQHFALIASLFLATLNLVTGGLVCVVASPVGLVSHMATLGSTPTVSLISSGVVSGKTFFLLRNI